MFDSSKLISDRALNIDASGIRKVFELARQLKNPINFSIGQPHFHVPQQIKDAAAKAIQNNKNSYTLTQGIPQLLDTVTKRFNTQYQIDSLWNNSAALITSGVSGGLLLALLACTGPDDEILIPDPYFVMYKHLATLTGATPVFFDTYPDFQITAERIKPHITPRTKMLIISSPSNPTGVVTTNSSLKKVAQLCAENNILLISDEIYDEFCYEKIDTPTGPQSPSPAAFSDNIIVLKGYSKTYAMTGWRLGYAIGPAQIIEQMTKLQQYTFVCAPSMVQQAALCAFDIDVSHHIADYKHKRDLVVEKLSPHYELTTPSGAFYAFPKVPTDETATQFVERAIKQNLLTIPGSVFSERDTHFRISYACPDDSLTQGLNILINLAKT